MSDFRLYDDPGADVAEITTDGATIKPFLNAISRVVDEAKVHIDEDGLSVRAVDPANVFMGDVTLQAGAFESYDLSEESTIGVPLGNLQSAVRRARKGSDDELTLSVQQRRLTATVARGYENTDVVSQSTMDLIDPDSIRQEPDIPELDRDVSLSIDAGAFTDALSYAVGGPSEQVWFKTQQVNQHATALYLSGETDVMSESVAISDVDTDATCEAVYSYDYMKQVLGGIGDVEPETITVLFDDEFPITVGMESEDRPFKAQYFLAPRVQSD
jgi:proliferating cell nuclear antigen